MNTDLFSVTFDAGTELWHWTRLPESRPAALVRKSHESFDTIKEAVAAAKTIANCSGGIFGMDFDTGVGGVRSDARQQWLLQQIRNAQTTIELEACIIAIFSYDLQMYACASRCAPYTTQLRDLHEKEYNVIQLPVADRRPIALRFAA